MGVNVYLTDKEISALYDAVTDHVTTFSEASPECRKIVEKELKNGLGSAMAKLLKNRRAGRVYAKYYLR